MQPNNLDQLGQRERYWQGRQVLDETVAAAQAAIEYGNLAEVRELLLQVGQQEEALRALASTLALRVPPSQIGTLLTAYLYLQRERLLEESGEPAQLIAGCAQLIELERQLAPPDDPSVSDARAMALEVLEARTERELAQGRHVRAGQLAEGMLGLAPGHPQAQVALLRALIGRVRQARGDGELDRAERELLPQAEAALARLRATPTPRLGTLEEELRRERAALTMALGAQAERLRQPSLAEEYYRRARADERYAAEAEARLRALQAARRPPRWAGALLALLAVAGLALVLLPALREPLCAAVGRPCPPPQRVEPPQRLEPPSPLVTESRAPMPRPTPVPVVAVQALPAAATPIGAPPTPPPPPPPSPTATPVPLLGRLINDHVAVYADPIDSSQEIALLPAGSLWHLCARAANRYLIAITDCHATQPLGWVTIRNFEPQFEGQFPRALVTPLPTPSP